MISNAIAATRFREEREAAGLPVATDKQIARAVRLIEGNAMLRQHNTPLGIQLLALNIPLTRQERKNTEGVTPTRRIRIGDASEIEADQAAVEEFVENNPDMTAQDAVAMIAETNGYLSGEALRKVSARIERFGNAFKEGASRFPTHIREKMVMFSFMAMAAKMCQARDMKEASASA